MLEQDQDKRTREEPEAEKPMEVQLGGRHLTLAVAGLALFGLVLFLLGRWSERMAQPSTVEVEPGASILAKDAPDPAAPRELTFYETLGKKQTPGLQSPAKTTAPSREAPAELPAAPPTSSAPAAKASEETSRSIEPSAPAGSERYRVQIASTRDLASARSLVDRLRERGYPARIDTASGPDGKERYKVRIGNYAERAPAEKIAEKVRTEEKVEAWIVKVQG